MKRLLQTVRTAVKALRRNVLRSALTTLGIVIGTAAVITMMEIGQGSARAVRETIARMGANNLMIQPGTAASGGISLGGGTQTTLTLQDAQALADECADVIGSVAPVVRARTQVVYGNKNWVPFYLYGTSPEYLEVRQWEELAEGYPFTQQDVRNGVQVCILGQTIVREMFGAESPIGKEVRINNQPFKVVGTLTPKGANMLGFDQDDILLAPWTAIKYKVSGTSVASVNQSATAASTDPRDQVNSLSARYPSQRVALYPTHSAAQLANNPTIDRLTNVDLIWVKVEKDIPAAKQRINEVLHRTHRIRAGQPNDFNIRDMAEQNAALGSSAQLIGGMLLSVALISLLVGGVGIMNIMLVSVTERTREIGLRMAVGARPRDILRQFLVEAIILCLIGGALGIAIGRLGSWLVSVLFSWPTDSSLPAVIASVSVSVAVGITFGFYPAWKASRLDPIQALRYE